MNYVERHFGDWSRDTAHLSLLEDGAYNRLCDLYYVRETPLPADLTACCRLVRAQSRQERQAVQAVLQEFFSLTGEGWRHKRCDLEIARFRAKSDKASASAKARWDRESAHSNGNANASAPAHAVASPNAVRTYGEGSANASTNASANAHANASADTMRTHSEGNATCGRGRARSHSPLPTTQYPGEAIGETELVAGTAEKSAASAAPTPPATRGTRLPADWALPKAWGAWAMAEYPQWTPEKVRHEGASFRDHWTAKSGRDAAKLDWEATWRNWCRSDLAHRSDPRPSGRVPAATPPDTAARNAEARRLLGFDTQPPLTGATDA